MACTLRRGQHCTRAFEHLRRTWVSPDHQSSLRQVRAIQRTEAAPVSATAPSAIGQPPARQCSDPWSADTCWQLLDWVLQGAFKAAAELLDRQLTALGTLDTAADPQRHMLQTELELLRHELSLATGRGQLKPLPLGADAATPLLNLVAQLAQGGAALRRDWQGLDPAERQTEPRRTDPRIGLLRAELALLHQALSLQQRRSQPQRYSEHNPQSLAALAMSQLGQDLWVLERSGYKTGGFFVEFGATDGVLLSNTWLLEQHFGWRGLCAEPNPGFYRQLQANRHCTVSAACIGAHTGDQVAFVLSDAFGGSLAHAHDDQHGAKRDADRDAGQVVTLETISLDDFLKQHQAPREIDTISIDTEGSEYEILSTFPFDDWQVRLFTIEHNYTERRQDIRRLMEQHGYVCTKAQWDDWYERKAD